MQAKNGESDHVIVLSDAAPAPTRYAAQELQRFIEEMTGAKLPIVSDGDPVRNKEIILGSNARIGRLGPNLDFDALGSEGYMLRTLGSRLIIAGGEPRGT